MVFGIRRKIRAFFHPENNGGHGRIPHLNPKRHKTKVSTEGFEQLITEFSKKTGIPIADARKVIKSYCEVDDKLHSTIAKDNIDIAKEQIPEFEQT
ncbi:MAG: hypothetical protein NUV57_01310 [archaeon]|nr:hypothetical protein [archaeon]